MTFNTEKADQTLQEWFQSLYDKLNELKQIHVVWYVLTIGVTIALATTGYMGEDSIDPFSLVGALFALNFFSMMLFASSKFNPTLKYLGKLFVAGLIGYAAFWQFMAMFSPSLGFEPFIAGDKSFGVFIFCMGVVGALIFSFSGHTEYIDPSATGITQAELEEMRNAMELVRQLPAETLSEYGYN